MDSGIATYILANAILADRRREADHRRLIAELKTARREARSRNRGSGRGSWSLEWGSNGFTGKSVTLVNSATGERLTGRDPGDWDKAMGRALRSVEAEAQELVGRSLAG